MTMFWRAIEGFVGRVTILLALSLTVFSAAYFCTQEACGVDFSNHLEGLWFQIQVQSEAVVQFFVDIWHWSTGR